MEDGSGGQAYARFLGSEIWVSLRYNNNDVQCHRKPDETVSIFLCRLGNNAKKLKSGKKPKNGKRKCHEEDVLAELLDANDHVIATSELHKIAEHSQSKLPCALKFTCAIRLNGIKYELIKDILTIEVGSPTPASVGCPVVSHFVVNDTRLDKEESSSLLTDVSNFAVKWYGCENCPKNYDKTESMKWMINRKEWTLESTGMTYLGNGPVFIPQPEHQNLKIFMQLGLGSRCSIHCVANNIRNSSLAEWNEHRMLNFKKSSKDNIKVLNFNCLAECYSTSPTAESTFFPYCAKGHLSFEYRRPLILHELFVAEADIYCLQECDEKEYHNTFSGFFKSLGFDSKFSPKKGGIKEGPLIAFRSSKYEMDYFYENSFVDLISSSTDSIASINNLISLLNLKWPGFIKSHKSLSSVYQFVLLKDKENRELLVANSHFYYHPSASHIRGLQMYVMLCVIDHLIKTKAPNAGVIICGDFNASTCTAAIQLVLDKYVPEAHPSWEYVNKLIAPPPRADLQDSSDNNEKETLSKDSQQDTSDTNGSVQSLPARTQCFPGIRLECPKSLSTLHSVYSEGTPCDISKSEGRSSGSHESLVENVQCTDDTCLVKQAHTLEFSNVVNGFDAVLDWIFYSSDKLKVEMSLQGVCLKNIRDRYERDGYAGGLPCNEYPSDHISIGAEFSWVGTTNSL